MARDVRVRLSAEIQAYLSAMQQAEQAATRVADAADRLGDISISADTSVASDLDQAASSADNASASMEGASGSAESMAGGMDSASAAAQDASAGIESAGASAETAAGGLSSVGAQSQTVTADMLSVSAAAQDAGGGLESAGASAETASAGLSSVGAQSQSVVADMMSASAGAQTFEASMASMGAQSQSVAGDMSSASAAMQAHGSIAQQASAGIDGLSASFASGLSYTSGFSGSLLEAGGHLSQYGTTMSGVIQDNRAFAGGLAAVGGGLAALMGSVINTGIQYNSLQQVAGRAMETMTGSASEAADQMERLHSFADESPFARDTWITAQQQLMAFGMEAERVVPTLEGVQNAVAAIGGGDAEIMQLVDILGQVEGQGRITGRELQRLGQMGINAADLIGDAMGVSGNEIREQITAGALDAETAIDALTTGMMTQFDGAAEGLRDTMEGSLDRIRARIRDIGSVLAEPLVSADGGGFLVDAMNMAADFGAALLDLPPVVLQVGASMAALGASVLAVGGVWGLAGGQIASFAAGALQAGRATIDLGRNMVTTAGGLRRLATGAGIAAAAVAGLMILDALSEDSEDVAASVQRMNQELIKAADGASAFENIQWTRASEGREHVEDLTGALQRLDEGGVQGVNDSMNRFFSSFLPINSAIDDLDLNIENLGESMNQAFSEGSFDQAAAGMREVAAAGEEAGYSAEMILDLFPQYAEELATLAQEAGHTASAQDILALATNEAALAALQNGESWDTVAQLIEQGADASYDAEAAMDSSADAADRTRDAYSRMGEAADEAAGQISGLVDDMNAMADIGRDAQQVEMDWIASIQEVNEAISEGETSLNRWTEEGRANREMLLGLAGDTLEAAASTATLGGSVDDVEENIQQGIGAIERFGEEAGLTSSQVEDLVREMYGIPDEVPIDVWAEDRATDVFNEVDGAMDEMDDEIQIWLEGEDRNVQDLINSFRDGDYETVVDIIGDSAYADEILQELQNGDYRAAVEIMAEMEEAQGAVAALQEGDYVAWIEFFGNPDDAEAALVAIQQGDYEALVEIVGNENAATDIWNGVMDTFNGMPPAVIDMNGDPTSFFSVLHDVANGDYSTVMGIEANDGPARGVLDALREGDYQALVDILGDSSLARQVMDAFLSGDYQTVADLLANDSQARSTVGTFTSTQWQTTIEAIAATMAAEGQLNRAARNRIATITARVVQVGQTASGIARSFAQRSGIFGNASGGRAGVGTGLAAYAAGGRLPSTGLGTDQILGLNRAGQPTAWVDDREWIINRRSSDRYDGLLQAINNDDPYGIKRYAAQLSGYAAGGRPGYQGQVREFSQPSAPRVTVQAPSGSGASRSTTVNNYTYYPIPEKTSRSQQRGAALAGMGFDPDEMGG